MDFALVKFKHGYTFKQTMDTHKFPENIISIRLHSSDETEKLPDLTVSNACKSLIAGLLVPMPSNVILKVWIGLLILRQKLVCAVLMINGYSCD